MKKNKKSFTLIELLVTVTIAAMFFAISLTRNNSFNEQRKLTSEAQKFSAILDLARKKALVSDTSVPCTGDFLGYRIFVNTNRYELRSHCLFGDTLISTYNFPPLMQAYNAPQTVDFRLLTSSATPSCIAIQNTNLNNSCYNIRVSQNGTFSSDKCSSCGTCCSTLPQPSSTPIPYLSPTPTPGVSTATTTFLSSTPNPSAINGTVTLNVTVTSSCAPLSGYIVFSSLSTGYLGYSSLTSGHAMLTTSFSNPGTYQLSAAFHSTTSCQSSNSNVVSQIVSTPITSTPIPPTTTPILPSPTTTLVPPSPTFLPPTPTPTPIVPSTPIGSCGSYNSGTNTIPVTWSWFPASPAVQLQVQDVTSYWWYNAGGVTSSYTISSKDNAGVIAGIPNGRQVSARVSADGLNWSSWSNLICTTSSPTPTPAPTLNPQIECSNYCQSIGKVGQSVCIAASACSAAAGQNVGTRTCTGGTICCCR